MAREYLSPVSGRADFTITEDGEPQAIRSFSAVSRPTESLALSEPAQPVSSDDATVAAPVSNQHMSDARVVALVLDDLHIGTLRTSLAQDAARRFVERLAPSDLLYVVRTATVASTGTFSRDRARALMLIGGLRGARIGDDTLQKLLHSPGTQPQRADSHRLLTETLVGVSKALQGVLGHSKTMVLISEGSSYGAPVDRLEARPQQRIDEATAPGGRVAATSDAAMALADVRTAAAAANVVIHTVSPTGLNNRVSDDLIQLSAPLSEDERRRIESEARQARDMLRQLADGQGASPPSIETTCSSQSTERSRGWTHIPAQLRLVGGGTPARPTAHRGHRRATRRTCACTPRLRSTGSRITGTAVGRGQSAAADASAALGRRAGRRGGDASPGGRREQKRRGDNVRGGRGSTWRRAAHRWRRRLSAGAGTPDGRQEGQSGQRQASCDGLQGPAGGSESSCRRPRSRVCGR